MHVIIMKVSMSIPPEKKRDFFEACKEKSPYIMKKRASYPPLNFEKKNQRLFYD